MPIPKIQFLLLLIGLSTCAKSNAQVNNLDKARVYYNVAINEYNEEQYSSALYYLSKAEMEIFNFHEQHPKDSTDHSYCADSEFEYKKHYRENTSDKILSLKIKARYQLYFNNIDDSLHNLKKADSIYHLFESKYSSSISDELKEDTFSYYAKIEEAIKTEECKYIDRKWKESIISLYEYKVCLRCEGNGYYLKYGKKDKKPLLKKNKKLTCDVCLGKGIRLVYLGNDEKLKYSGDTKKFQDLTQEEFAHLFDSEIKLYSNKVYDENWIASNIHILNASSESEITHYKGVNDDLKKLTTESFKLVFDKRLNKKHDKTELFPLLHYFGW